MWTGLFTKAPPSMFAPPLILLLGSSAFANQIPTYKCFSATVSGNSNYDACCSVTQEGVAWLGDPGDGDASQAFRYSCASYIGNNYEEVPELVHSARACAEVCANDPSCHAGAWDSSTSICFTTSETDPEFVRDPEKTFLRFVKINGADIHPANPDPVDCGDQVADAREACQYEQEEKCKNRMASQRKDLSSECDQRIADQCSQSSSDEQAAEKCEKEKSALQRSLRAECEGEKDRAAKQCDAQNRKARVALEDKVKQLQERDEENKRKADENKRALDQLQQQNKQLQDRIEKGFSKQPPPAKEPPVTKPPDSRSPPPSVLDQDPVYDVPPLTKFNKKCTDMEGQEYTVMGVTYTVFCGVHPDDGMPAKREWRAKDPAFLMGMCSTTPGCQGVKLRENFAQLSFKHELPPSQRVDRKYWSLVPKEQRQSNDGPDIRSQVMDDDNTVRCPEVDGQIMTLGDRSYQLNCKKNFSANKRKTASGVKTFNECLVSCSVTKGCRGIMRGNYCSLVFSHRVLPHATPEEEQSTGDSWVAMLTEA
jgi:hypothetical protein